MNLKSFVWMYYYNNFIIGAWLSSWSQGAGSVWGQVHSLSVWCVLFLSERLLITLPKCTINRLDISVQYLIWCWRKYEALSLRVTVFTVCFVESPFHLKQKPVRNTENISIQSTTEYMQKQPILSVTQTCAGQDAARSRGVFCERRRNAGADSCDPRWHHCLVNAASPAWVSVIPSLTTSTRRT